MIERAASGFRAVSAAALVCLMLVGVCHGQGFTVSGHLEQGHVMDIHHVSLSIGDIGVHWFGAVVPNYGVSWSPVEWRGVKAGVIGSRRGFPTAKDMSVNFIVDAGFSINGVRISWTHISNGFGLWHQPNHGFDAISFTILL